MKQWNIKKQDLHGNHGRYHKYYIRAMAIMPNSKYLFTGDYKGKLKQWNIKKEKNKFKFKNAHNGCVCAINISPCGERMFSGDNDGYLKQWSIKKKECVKVWGKIMENWIDTMTISVINNQCYLFVSGDVGTLQQWDLDKGVLIKTNKGYHEKEILCIASSH